MNHWLAIGGMAVVTFLIRASFLVFGQGLVFPPLVKRALRYVPVAVLPALVVPMALAPQGELWLSPMNPYLIGTLVAGLVAWRTRNTLLAIVISFIAYAAVRFLTR
ncbi:AzlD domain-containing protein [Neisseriaceae bacterium JH1-16]|nr:AzlD domain-containing protein [Neisseriaceae bacterium JH1-16]